MAGMTAAAGISAGVSVLGGAFQALTGAKQARDAERALNNLKVPEITNVTEGMQVSTLGADLQRQEAGRQFATGVDALRSGGIRGIVGGLGTLNAQQNLVDKQIGTDLDTQQRQIDQMRAQDEARRQAIFEQRHSQNVAALSSQISGGRQAVMQGVSGALQGVASGAQMAQEQNNFDKSLSAYSSSNNPFLGTAITNNLVPAGLSGTFAGNNLPTKYPQPMGLTYNTQPTTNLKF